MDKVGSVVLGACTPSLSNRVNPWFSEVWFLVLVEDYSLLWFGMKLVFHGRKIAALCKEPQELSHFLSLSALVTG